jgi:hypothetical protein
MDRRDGSESLNRQGAKGTKAFVRRCRGWAQIVSEPSYSISLYFICEHLRSSADQSFVCNKKRGSRNNNKNTCRLRPSSSLSLGGRRCYLRGCASTYELSKSQPVDGAIHSIAAVEWRVGNLEWGVRTSWPCSAPFSLLSVSSSILQACDLCRLPYSGLTPSRGAPRRRAEHATSHQRRSRVVHVTELV